MQFPKISLLVLCLVSSISWARSNDTQKPIYIDSLSQELDMKTNRVIFTGDVKFKQGSIKILAKKIIITKSKNGKGLKKIDAYGNPTYFSQIIDNGSLIKANAKHMSYDLVGDNLTLIDHAEIVQNDSTIKGNLINYSIKQQKLKARSGEKQRVTTVIVPDTN